MWCIHERGCRVKFVMMVGFRAIKMAGEGRERGNCESVQSLWCIPGRGCGANILMNEVPLGRLALCAFVSLGRTQAISAGKGPLNTYQKALLFLERGYYYESSTYHSLIAPPTCVFQNSTLPYFPRFTPAPRTYRCEEFRV